MSQDLSHGPEPSSKKQFQDLNGDEFIELVESSSPEEISQMLSTLNERPASPAKEHGIFSPLLLQDAEPRSFFNVLWWWELRRIPYNLLVGICGLPALALFVGHFYSYPQGTLLIFIGILGYAVAANICYCAGPVSELLIRIWSVEKASKAAPKLYLTGLYFSMFMTLALSALMFIAWLVKP
jgi:hypothetical protein